MKRNLANLSLNMLVVLDSVCRLKSTTKSAAELNISQPAISQYLKRLRELTGSDLFIRSQTGLEPTQTGLELWKRSTQALDICEDVAQFSTKTFDPYNSEKKFTIAIPLFDTDFFLQQLTLNALNEFPSINIHLINASASHALEALEGQKIDMYIGYKPDQTHKSLEVKKAIDVKFSIICSEQSPFYRKDIIDKDDFISSPSIMIFSQFHETILDKELSAKGLLQDEFLLVPDLEAVPHVLNNTNSMFLATTKRAQKFCKKHDSLKILKTTFELPKIELHQIWHRSYTNNNAHIWLRNYIDQNIN